MEHVTAQVWVLMIRNCRMYLRNPELMAAKLVTYVGMGAFMGEQPLKSPCSMQHKITLCSTALVERMRHDYCMVAKAGQGSRAARKLFSSPRYSERPPKTYPKSGNPGPLLSVKQLR